MRGWWEGPLPDFGQVAWTNERLAGPGGRGGLQTAETDEVSGVGLVVAGSCVVSVRLRSAPYRAQSLDWVSTLLTRFKHSWSHCI